MIRRRKKNKGARAKVNDVKKETYKDPVKKCMLAARSVRRRCFKQSASKTALQSASNATSASG